MNFVALLLGLGLERLLTSLFHLREFRWLDPWIDRISDQLENASPVVATLGIGIYALVAVLPVALIAWLSSGMLFQIPHFLLAVVVLLFSLGPRDLLTEVREYCDAIRAGTEEDIQRITRELREGDAPQGDEAQIAAVRRAIFVQANNRIFAVVFWFILFGPAGAWLFRVVDLLRRRLAYEYSRDGEVTPSAFIRAVRTLHGVLAWPSAHLLILGYALAGSYEGGLSAWRTYASHRAQDFFVATNDLLDLVGNGASSQQPVPDDGAPLSVVRVNEAMSLVTRTLWLIWAPIIALLTLSDWLN